MQYNTEFCHRNIILCHKTISGTCDKQLDHYMENLLYGDPSLPFPFLGLDGSLLIPNLDENWTETSHLDRCTFFFLLFFNDVKINIYFIKEWEDKYLEIIFGQSGTEGGWRQTVPKKDWRCWTSFFVLLTRTFLGSVLECVRYRGSMGR